ncbi:WD40 domain-containing protein [Ordospora colligata]|nr:WD40 domain-containing protein [Ordospora colligata]
MNINLSDIFTTAGRQHTQKEDRYTKNTIGIHTSILASTKISTFPRSSRIKNRHIDTSPHRILDAPGMLDDYYLNLLDWSTTNIVVIGLGEAVYGYSVHDKSVVEMYSGSDYVSSVKTSGNMLCIGNSDGSMNLIDMCTNKVMQSIKNHNARISSLSWNGNIISSGDKVGRLCNMDIRSGQVSAIGGHSQEICGLAWSADLRYLASGGNDNTIRIWQLGNNNSQTLSGHKSAVKALAWCPWRSGILTSGGGTKDMTIKFWDVTENKLERSIDTHSQVCTLTYLPKYKEIISSHGYSENDIRIWKASTMSLISSFGKHGSRVLHVAPSPDGSELASASADENLKFWKLFSVEKPVPRRDSLPFR